MSLFNQVRHYAGAVVRGLVSGRLFQVAGTYWRHRRIEAQVVGRLGLDVRGGPFAGMRYIRIPSADSIVSKLTGLYEREIHGFVEQAIATRLMCCSISAQPKGIMP